MKAQDQPEPVKDLFSVSNHFGGMGGGHGTFVEFPASLLILCVGFL